MKIISKHKDYYDYLVGTYGMDETMVFDRRYPYYIKPEPSTSLEVFDIAICGKWYRVHTYLGKFYHTLEEIKILNAILKKKDEYVYYTLRYKNKVKEAEIYWKEHNLTEAKINYEQRCPVLLVANHDCYQVLLKDFGFPAWYPADKFYQDIYTFISYLKDHPEIPNKQTNKEKIVAHGFDLKKSFRHRVDPDTKKR